MSVLNDATIRAWSLGDSKMIAPFAERTEGGGLVSYGLSSYGYDARLSTEFKVPTTKIRMEHEGWQAPLCPKTVVEEDFRGVVSESPVLVYPGSFVLARTFEYFRIPRSIIGVCTGKSTYARLGILVNVTPLEPEWEGYVTLEISNTSQRPVYLYPNEGICQFNFHVANKLCEVSYKDRKGKYQGQTVVTIAKVT